MARSTTGGGGNVRIYRLYDDTKTLLSNIAPANLALYDVRDDVILESTAASFSDNTLTFTTNRGDVKSKKFFKEMAVAAAEGGETIKSENNKEVAVSAGGGDVSKKCLILYLSNNSVYDSTTSPATYKREILAGVGYFSKQSREWGATAGGQMNKYSWTFTVEKATLEEYGLIIGASAFEGEPGYDDDLASDDWLKTNPLTLWDRDDTIQQMFVA